MYKLRELEKKDIKEINSWRQSGELIEFLEAPYRYINIDVEDEWYENYLRNRNNTIRCAITTEEDKAIGLITLADINNISRSAELHIMIGKEENCGKGIGSFAIKEMLNHAFLDLNLHRVELQVLEYNDRAKKAYQKIGFKYEGTRREACFKKGKYINLEIMSILKDEFLSCNVDSSINL